MIKSVSVHLIIFYLIVNKCTNLGVLIVQSNCFASERVIRINFTLRLCPFGSSKFDVYCNIDKKFVHKSYII